MLKITTNPSRLGLCHPYHGPVFSSSLLVHNVLVQSSSPPWGRCYIIRMWRPGYRDPRLLHRFTSHGARGSCHSFFWLVLLCLFTPCLSMIAQDILISLKIVSCMLNWGDYPSSPWMKILSWALPVTRKRSISMHKSPINFQSHHRHAFFFFLRFLLHSS